MSSARNIIVSCATGRQGRAFIRAIFQSPPAPLQDGLGYHIWALTRDSSGAAARRLIEEEKDHANHITVYECDLNSSTSVRELFQRVGAEGGVFGVFAVLAYPGLGKKSDIELSQGKLLADLALESKVEVFLYSSAIPAGESQGDIRDYSHRAKLAVESYCMELGEKGLNWVIMRPGFFMEVFVGGIMASLAVSLLSASLRPDTTIAAVAAEDNGRVAAGVFKDHKRFLHRILAVTGESITMQDVSSTYKEVFGKDIPKTPELLSKLFLRFSTGAKDVVHQVERNHDARTNGAYPTFEAEVANAKEASTLQTYREWLVNLKAVTSQ